MEYKVFEIEDYRNIVKLLGDSDRVLYGEEYQ